MCIYNKNNNCLCIKGLVRIFWGIGLFIDSFMNNRHNNGSKQHGCHSCGQFNKHRYPPDQGAGKPENRSVVASIYIVIDAALDAVLSMLNVFGTQRLRWMQA